MPLLFWLLYRIFKALAATVRLLTDWKVLRRLPWGYIRALPRRDPWVGVLTATLCVSALLAIVGVAFAPPVAMTGVAVGFAGIVSSWIRLARR